MSTSEEQILWLDRFVGRVTYRGDWHPFLPLLRLGETIHVGKGTSFGPGKYEMEREK